MTEADELKRQITELQEQIWQAYQEIRQREGAGVSKGLKEGIGFGRRAMLVAELKRRELRQ